MMDTPCLILGWHPRGVRDIPFAPPIANAYCKRERVYALGRRTELGVRVLVVFRFGLFAAIAVLVLVAARSSSASALGSQVAACGTERWTVKALQDRPRLRAVQATTVAHLVNLPAPASQPDTRLPFERHVFRVVARVVLVRQEADSDLHLVL